MPTLDLHKKDLHAVNSCVQCELESNCVVLPIPHIPEGCQVNYVEVLVAQEIILKYFVLV